MLAMLHVQRKRLKTLQPKDEASAQHAVGLDVMLCPQGAHAVLKHPRPSQMASMSSGGGGGGNVGVGGNGDGRHAGDGMAAGGRGGGLESGGGGSTGENVLIELDGTMLLYPKRQVMSSPPQTLLGRNTTHSLDCRSMRKVWG